MIARRLPRPWVTALGLILSLAGCTACGNALPYKDSNANGYIGLCSKTGKPINHGKVGDIPFVPVSVSSSPVPPGYNAYLKTATLYAYVPRPGYPPEDWLGRQISASSFYSNGLHPMVQAADEDGAVLQQFVHDFPPGWDGLIELRMYLSVPDRSVLNSTYPATDIRVKGDAWTVVRGGDVPCDSGTASSSVTPPPPQPTPTGAVQPSLTGTSRPAATGH